MGDCNALNVWNEHWAVQAQMCQVCGTNFTMIFKAETLNHDMAYLTQKHTILNKTDFGCTAAAPNGTMRSDESGFDLIKRVYSEVPLKTRKAIYEFYEDDFRLFGYEWNVSLQHPGNRGRVPRLESVAGGRSDE